MARAIKSPVWDRCGNTEFYHPRGVEEDSLEQLFIDPVDLVIVASSPKEGELEVTKSWLEEFRRDEFEAYVDGLPEPQRQQVLLWIRGTFDAAIEREEFKPDLLRRLDNAKTEVRTNVLDGLLKFLIGSTVSLGRYERTIARSPEAMWEALSGFGVHEC